MSLSLRPNSRNGVIGDSELEWMWSLARRQHALDVKWRKQEEAQIWFRKKQEKQIGIPWKKYRDVWSHIFFLMNCLKLKDAKRPFILIQIEGENIRVYVKKRK